MSIFTSADILLPKDADMEKWSVIACDQFTSQKDYWIKAHETVGDAPSALKLIMPEAELPAEEGRIDAINAEMKAYLENGIFEEKKNSFIYVERTLNNGKIRKGLVGMIDLEEYDYNAGSVSAIRATEKTVIERIPPRVNIRRGASLELPHVLLLCDDEERMMIEPLGVSRRGLPLVYDFELMQGGGHISGWLVTGLPLRALKSRIEDYEKKAAAKGLIYAVGDGNHSLAAAKACYMENKRPEARYALVELENIHDEAQEFEPIHRIVTGTDTEKLIEAFKKLDDEHGTEVRWYAGEKCGTVRVAGLPVGTVQGFLDAYLAENPGETDYIHGDDVTIELSKQENAVGFVLPPVEKAAFFDSIAENGTLPRKTFSMGSANEKRYYLEAKKI